MNERNNTKQNQNSKPEMWIEQNPDKRKQEYLNSLRCLEVIKNANKNGIALKNTRKVRKKHEAVVDKYLKEVANIPKEKQSRIRFFNRRERRQLLKRGKQYFSNLREFTDVIRDPLCLTIVKTTKRFNKPVRTEWPSIESDLMELVAAYNLTNKNGPTPRYDTSEIHRGFRVIKCMDEFSKYFMYKSFRQIKDKWKKTLRLIPAEKIPEFIDGSRPEETNPPHSTRPASEVITDPLCMAVAGERRGYDVPVRYEWPSIESELMKLITNYNRTNENGPALSCDTTEIHRGFRIIKFINEFSKEVICGWFINIGKKWKDIHLKLIPAKNLPKKQKKPVNRAETIYLNNAQNELNNSKSFGENNSEPEIINKPELPISSALTPTFCPAQSKRNYKLESVYDNRNSERFRQLNTTKNINKHGDDVTESTHERKNVEHAPFIMEAPQASRRSSLQNSPSYINPYENMGFQLSETYDSKEERNNSSTQHKMLQNSYKTANYQQGYSHFSWESNYNVPASNYLGPGRDFKFFEEPQTERKRTYSDDWQKPTNYYGGSKANLEENYQNPSYSNEYRNPESFFNNTNQNLRTFTDSPREEAFYNRFSPSPPNLELRYRKPYEDTSFSTHCSSSYTQRYSLEHHSHNSFPGNDDETPPPPPSFRMFDDPADSLERLREKRRRRF